MKTGFNITISNNTPKIESFLAGKNDDFYLQESHLEFLIEGVILNKKKLLQEFALKDFRTFILEVYQHKKVDILKEFEGEFRGFIWDKNDDKFYIFTNPTSTQRVFYTKSEGVFLVDTSLVRLKENLHKNNLPVHPDLEAIYLLLCVGNMLENKSIIEGSKKILDGHYLEIDLKNLNFQEKEYFNFFNENYFQHSKKQAYRQIDEVFRNSVLLEYDKDDEYGAHHLSLLSGGLDSRVAMFYALKNGKIPENVFCFSQSDYYDETISRKIAEDYHLHYEFVPLDGGKFLKKIDQLTEISEGLVGFTGGIHVQHAVDQLQYQNFSLFHSGQIGDGVLGGFNSEPKAKKPSRYKIVTNPQFLPQTEEYLEKILKKYETEETFLIRNLAFNRTLLGAHVFQQKAYQTSPFMTKDFLKFAIKLPESWKFNHQFYLEWIAEYCQEATKYTWERTLMKPNASWKTSFGDRFLKPVFKKFNEKILHTPQKASMYPYQFYFDQDSEIQEFYQNYFDKNIERIADFPELRKQVEDLFTAPDFFSKSQAVNVLSVFKLYF